MPRCFLPKKTGGWEPLYIPPPRVRSVSPSLEQIWTPRSPTAGETAPSPPLENSHSSAAPALSSSSYTPSGYPLDLHITTASPRHVYYGEVSRPPDEISEVQLLQPPQPPSALEVVHQHSAADSDDRIVQVHIPELPHSPQYHTQFQHKASLFYNGYLAENRGYSPPAPVALPLTPSPDARPLTPPETLTRLSPTLVTLGVPRYDVRHEEEPMNLTTRPIPLYERPPEDLSTAHAILDLSRARVSEYSPPHTPPHLPFNNICPPLAYLPSQHHQVSSPVATEEPHSELSQQNTSIHSVSHQVHESTPHIHYSNISSHEILNPCSPSDTIIDVDDTTTKSSEGDGKTVAYTYEAFFVSDGRAKRQTQEEIDKTRYACSECGKQYATSSNLSRHKQTHRTLDSGNARRCHVCGKAYVSMPALAMHVLTHNLNHKCGVCGKAFSRPWLLQGHMRSHTGEKPFGCAHCGKSFADRSNLRAHMQTHSQLKNFKCKRCNKSFALKSYLNKHYESACFKDVPLPPSSPDSSSLSSDEVLASCAA